MDLLVRFIWGWFVTLLFHARLETSERYLQIALRYMMVAAILGALVVYRGRGLGARTQVDLYLALGLMVAGGALYCLFSGRLARAVGALAVIVAPAVSAHYWGVATSIHFIGGSLVLASPLASQFLGHWYLNVVGMDIRELTRSMNVMFFALTLKTLEISWTLLDRFFIRPEKAVHLWMGLMLAMRVVWGLMAPWMMAWMVYESVKIRSTQSATGILYAASVAVIVGELISLYLRQILGWYL